MRSVSSALATAFGAPVQQPAILVEIAFATTVRWSSFATVSWNSLTWTKEAVSVDGLVVDPLSIRGSLVIANGDDAPGDLVLSEGVVDRSIRIWGYDAAATALADVLLLCEAVGGAARINTRSVAISLRSPSEFLLSPRTYVGPAAGFNNLLPGGTKLKINGLDMQLGTR